MMLPSYGAESQDSQSLIGLIRPWAQVFVYTVQGKLTHRVTVLGYPHLYARLRGRVSLTPCCTKSDSGGGGLQSGLPLFDKISTLPLSAVK